MCPAIRTTSVVVSCMEHPFLCCVCGIHVVLEVENVFIKIQCTYNCTDMQVGLQKRRKEEMDKDKELKTIMDFVFGHESDED